MKNKFLILVMIFGLTCLTSCAQAPQFATHQIETYPKPALQVYIAPEERLDLQESSALLDKVRLFLPDKQSLSEAMTTQVKDVLLQCRIFKQIEVFQPDSAKKDIYMAAFEKHADYVIEVGIPQMLAPAGNTPGWICLDMKIVRAKDHVTFWSIYAEVHLEMRHKQNYLLYERPYAQAPSLSQGLDAIVREVAKAITTM